MANETIAEGKERARQATWLEYWEGDENTFNYKDDVKRAFHAGFDAADRSLEQERAAILKLVECAFDMLPSNTAGACYELRRAIRELRAVPKGDS